MTIPAVEPNIAESQQPTSPSGVAATVDKSGSSVREMFRQIAPRYDTMNHLLSLNIDRYWRWRAVRRLRIRPQVPILDTCTGTGDLAIAIADRAPKSVDVVGSDFCHAMLEIAPTKPIRLPIRPPASTFSKPIHNPCRLRTTPFSA